MPPFALVNPGFDEGVLIDCGRSKLYTCQRCGYRETNLGHPMRDWLRGLFADFRVDATVIGGALIFLLGMVIALVAVSH